MSSSPSQLLALLRFISEDEPLVAFLVGELFNMRRSVLFLLILGIAIRIPDLPRPVNEGHRNAQTATLTAGMLENGQLRFDPIAPWRGNFGARLVQELPVYNLAALAVGTLPGVTLDMAGRITSLIFWILSFIALQALWRRTLAPKAAFWANLLFIFSPLNWYLSTAFMPESLLQLLAICFMICVLNYARKRNSSAFIGLFLSALLGLLVKLPGFVHLGLFAALVLLDRQGQRSLLRPALWGAALFIGGAIFAWGEYVKATNLQHFPYWAGFENLLGFIQPGRSRFAISYYVPLVGYNLAFVLPFIVAPFAALGAMQACRGARACFADRIWLYLAASLMVYWLVWAKAAPSHSYYNLQNLVLFTALFGIGVARALRWMATRDVPAWMPSVTRVLITVIILVSGFAGYRYLTRPDQVTVKVAQWVNANTTNEAIILYQPRHAPAAMDYEHQPLLSHLTRRHTWIWTRTTPEEEKSRALQTSTYVVITCAPPYIGMFEGIRQAIKGPSPQPPPAIDEIYPESFTAIATTECYRILGIENSQVR